MASVTEYRNKVAFMPSGQFAVGANYWASHAGTNMWSDWKPEIVSEDFDRLAVAGLQILRVFPLWSDFQPINQLRGVHGKPTEIRHGDEALTTDIGGASDGVSAVMIERFRQMADLAEAKGLKLIVGLITGWMSGRLHVPPALEGLNPITDPLSMMWQVRLVTRIVRELRDHPAIAAWDLGNECDCMGHASRTQAWVWTSAITGAIRGNDASRLIVSGMHGLPVDPEKTWSISDQGELTDILTTHPYPFFTPHCDQDPVDSMRPILHASTETLLYSDISGKPAFAEEIGTLGPMIANEATAASFARSSLFSLWAHDCRAALWWCAFDQLHLPHPPYDWNACETELGLMRVDRSEKPVLKEIGSLRKALQELPFKTLPPRTIEAVCLLSAQQDSWGAAQSAFLLAKQAGFDLSFAFIGSGIPDAELYLLPSVDGGQAIRESRIKELLEKVKNGATLYVSVGSTFFTEFEKITGLEIVSRRKRSKPFSANFEGIASGLKWEKDTPVQFQVKPTRAEVLGLEDNGNPIFSKSSYGNGTIFFLGFPLETQLANIPDAFQDGPEMWKLYQEIASEVVKDRTLKKRSPNVGITEHIVSETERIAVIINYHHETLNEDITVVDGWSLDQVYRGARPIQGYCRLSVDLRCLDAAVWHLKRSS